MTRGNVRSGVNGGRSYVCAKGGAGRELSRLQLRGHAQAPAEPQARDKFEEHEQKSPPLPQEAREDDWLAAHNTSGSEHRDGIKLIRLELCFHLRLELMVLVLLPASHQAAGSASASC